MKNILLERILSTFKSLRFSEDFKLHCAFYIEALLREEEFKASQFMNTDSLRPHSHLQKQVLDAVLNMQVLQLPLQSTHLESACAATSRILIQE